VVSLRSNSSIASPVCPHRTATVVCSLWLGAGLCYGRWSVLNKLMTLMNVGVSTGGWKEDAGEVGVCKGCGCEHECVLGSDVWLTVHRNSVWDKKPSKCHFCVIAYFFFTSCSTCFGQPCAHLQELTTA